MNLLTSSLSTSFSVPSSLSWAHGGMETDATISDETDKGLVSIVLCTITDKVSDIFLFYLFVSILFFICGCKITANLEQYYPLYLRYYSGYLRKRR